MSIENPSFDEPQAEQPPQPQESGAYVPSWEKDRKDSLAARSLASLEAEIERRRSGAENFGTDEQISENRGIQELEREIENAFKKVDFILTPTVPVLPFKIGEKMSDPVSMYLCDIFSAPANLTGIPAIALPSGYTESGLPMSIQFMAPHFREDMLFDIGKKFESLR